MKPQARVRAVTPGPATASPSVVPTATATGKAAREIAALPPTTTVVAHEAAATPAVPVQAVPAEPASPRSSAAPIAAPASEPATQPLSESAQPNAPGVAAEPPAASPQVITIDDFAKVDLRVAQILVAERGPKADKLLRLEVDLGYEKRQILAGITQSTSPKNSSAARS